MGIGVKLIGMQLNTVPGAVLDLDIKPGERIGLTGVNGGGKSSLLRYLACLSRPVAMGQLLLDGMDPFHAHDQEKLRRKIAFLLQEPEKGVVFSRVKQDAVFGPENLAVAPEVIRKRWMGLAGKLLNRGDRSAEQLNYPELSGGQKQLAALVSVMMMRSELLLLDEPFAMLGEGEKAEILHFLLQMTRRLEQTVVLVSHDPQVLRSMNRVFALENGRLEELGRLKGEWVRKADRTPYIFQYAENEEEPDEESVPSGETVGSPEAEKKLILIPPGASQTAVEKTEDTEKGPEKPVFSRIAGVESVEVFAPVITLQQVSFRYGTNTVLKDYSAAIYPGIYYELSGGTGSGKSTLCRLMNGTLRADEGEIRVKGMEVPGKKEKSGSLRQLRTTVGLVMQHPEDQLFASTVLEDVMYGPGKKGKTKQEARQDAEDALTILGIDSHLWAKAPEKLSGGERRRVAIAGILAMKPEVFILDEPFAGLDAQGSYILREVLKEYVRQGKTVIVTTHGKR